MGHDSVLYAVYNIFMYINMVCLWEWAKEKNHSVYYTVLGKLLHIFFFFFVNGDENDFAVSHIKILYNIHYIMYYIANNM